HLPEWTGCDERRPAPPCPPTPRSCSRGTRRLSRRHARCGRWPFSFHLLDNLFQFRRHFRKGLATKLHRPIAPLPNHDVDLAEGRFFIAIILAELAAAPSLALRGRAGVCSRPLDQVGRVGAVCQPGLNSRLPVTPTVPARCQSFCKPSSA